jgi:hypothetical protein
MTEEQSPASQPPDGPSANIGPRENVVSAAPLKRMSRSEIIGWILLVGSLILGFGLTIFAPN